MKKLFIFSLLSFFILFGHVSSTQAACNDWPQNQCGDRCGHFNNCGGEASRPGSAYSCIDKYEWSTSSNCCNSKGSSWQVNEICGTGDGNSDSVGVSGRVLDCNGQPLAGVKIDMPRKDAYSDREEDWQYGSPNPSTTTDANGNYSMSVAYKLDRIFRVEVNLGDPRTFVGEGNSICTANNTRPKHSWCEHNKMKGVSQEINFKQTNCQSQIPPSCQSVTVNGSASAGIGVTKTFAEGDEVTYVTKGTGSVTKLSLCFHATYLVSGRTWSQDWKCYEAAPNASGTYTVKLKFSDIRSAIVGMNTGYTVADINSKGLQYSATAQSPNGVFCDGGDKWTDGGAKWNNGNSQCSYNHTGCAGKVARSTTPPPTDPPTTPPPTDSPTTPPPPPPPNDPPSNNKTCSVNSPDPSTITTNQSKRINVVGKSSNTTKEPTRLIISKSNFTRMASPPSGTRETQVEGRYYYVFQSQTPAVANGSFETGNTSGWKGSLGTLSEFKAINGQTFPPKADGQYYLKATRGSSGDAFVVSDWIETNSDVTGQSFDLSFMARSDSNNTQTNKISGIFVQRFPTNCTPALCSDPIFASAEADFGEVNLTDAWKSFNRKVTFPVPGSGNTSSRVRVVLRVSPTVGAPVYYDKIELSRSVNNFFDCSTSSSVQCSASATLSGLPEGSYNAYCDLPTDPGRCSGNPACTYEGCTGSYCTSCAGWKSCSNNDNLKFTVAPSCTDANPTPITAMSVSASDNEASKHDLSVSSGSPTQLTLPSTSSKVKLYWNQPSGSSNTKYEVVVFKQLSGSTSMTPAEAYNAAKGGSVLAKLYTVNASGNSGLSITHTPTSNQTYRLSVAIRAINDDTCAPTPSKFTGWNRFYLDLVSNVSGSFKLVTANICSGGSNTSPSGEVNNTRNPGNIISPSSGNLAINGANSYVIGGIPFTPNSSWGENTIRFNILNSDPSSAYVCASCNKEPGSDPYRCVAVPPAPRTAPSNNNNFFLLQYDLSNDPWWQVAGGLVYSGGAMSSTIPDACGGPIDPTCIKALVTKALGMNDARTAGLPLTGADSIQKGAGLFSENDGNPRVTKTKFDSINNNPEDYQFFVRKTELSGGELPDTISKKSDLQGGKQLSDGTKVYYRNGNLKIKPQDDNPLAIGSTGNPEKVVIFVRGNLTIDGQANSQLFTVANGSYFGVIVSGEIRIKPSVGYDITDANKSSSMPANISGVFVADKIIVESDNNKNTQDKKFIGEGTFVGWNRTSGISLNRDFTSDDLGKRFHSGSPTESFVYRPSYLEDTPEFMKTAGMLWQEVN